MGPSEVNGVTPGDARESGIQALAEKEEEPPCERRMPEANHRTLGSRLRLESGPVSEWRVGEGKTARVVENSTKW